MGGSFQGRCRPEKRLYASFVFAWMQEGVGWTLGQIFFGYAVVSRGLFYFDSDAKMFPADLVVAILAGHQVRKLILSW